MVKEKVSLTYHLIADLQMMKHSSLTLGQTWNQNLELFLLKILFRLSHQWNCSTEPHISEVPAETYSYLFYFNAALNKTRCESSVFRLYSEYKTTPTPRGQRADKICPRTSSAKASIFTKLIRPDGVFFLAYNSHHHKHHTGSLLSHLPSKYNRI